MRMGKCREGRFKKPAPLHFRGGVNLVPPNHPQNIVMGAYLSGHRVLTSLSVKGCQRMHKICLFPVACFIYGGGDLLISRTMNRVHFDLSQNSHQAPILSGQISHDSKLISTTHR